MITVPQLKIFNGIFHMMIRRQKNRYLLISISLSTISILVSVFINNQIAQEYLRSDGKPMAVFWNERNLPIWIPEYVVTLGVTSLIFAILSLKGT